MHKNDLSPRPENQVRSPRQILGVEPVSVAEGKNEPPNGEFRSRVAAVDAGHDLGPLPWRQIIHGTLIACKTKLLNYVLPRFLGEDGSLDFNTDLGPVRSMVLEVRGFAMLADLSVTDG